MKTKNRGNGSNNRIFALLRRLILRSPLDSRYALNDFFKAGLGLFCRKGLFYPKAGKDPPMLQWRRAKGKTRSAVCLAGANKRP